METYAARLLKLILDRCQGASVSEIRFISGMSPAFVDEDGPHFLEIASLSSELVSEIHHLCHSLADENQSQPQSSSTYTFALKHLGRILCKYQLRGNAASLILVLDADIAETIEAIRPKSPRSSGAEAKRDSNGESE